GAGDAMNLGLGKGFSVRELVDVARSVTGVDFTVHETARRAGDVPVLYADASRARAVLGWEPQHLDLHEIIGSAWHWISAHPRGYASDTNRT
ncbi:MAG: UDP-glucose 4-epimerase GalE, partial [Myxococcales bacterium]|nr:UDP-glucose 4-epimerase GalE [Myxococcales bacterium]